jgi:predicted ribosomally synthesized peptide with nif11-like leader
MENKLTPEMLEKAKTAKSPEELISLAKESGIELSSEQAAAYFAKLSSEDGGLTDDELDNVSGGGCFGEDYDNRIKVSPTTHDCMYYACGICEEQAYYCKCRSMGEHNCGTCLHIRYDTDGVTYCNSVNVKQRGRPTYT